MTSFAIHHGLMPMYAGQILGTDSSSIHACVPNLPQQSECSKQSFGKYGKIQDGLEASISIDGKSRITRIISEIKLLSDVEKLLLYLKLPTGGLTDEHQRMTPPSCLQASNRTEQAQALTWIKSHLEEHSDVCLPKQEVYDDYKTYCENHGHRPLCNPDFGKMMKYAFPDIIARRLGKRGQSKYFYGGLRKKVDMAPPVLPELQVQSKRAEDETKENDDLLLAAGQVVCEWAQKLLEQSFPGLRDLAEHLVSNLYVGSKSVAAFTVIAAMQESGNQTGKSSALFSATSNNAVDKHRETQLQLQRKLQEKKLLEEQRRKMNAVREENEQQLRTNSALGRKTPLTPKNISRGSVNLDSKTPKVPSTPSPLPLQSPRKFQTGRSLSQSDEHIQPVALTKQTVAQTTQSSHIQVNKMKNTNDGTVEVKGKEKTDSVMVEKEFTDSTEENVFTFPKPVQENADASKTPEHCQMDTDDVPSHVRRIDFDGVISVSEENKEVRPDMITESDSKVNNKTDKSDVGTSGRTDNENSKVAMEENDPNVKISKAQGLFSQSAGQLSLKMLLERKDLNESSLNKSLGFVSSRGANLFAGQSSNLSRSAFVPFSQSRKEVNQQSSSLALSTSSTLVSSKQTVFNTTSESIPKSATVTITPLVNTNQGATYVSDPINRPPDNIIHIQPGNTYHEKERSLADKPITIETTSPKNPSVIVSFSATTKTNGAEFINTVVTSSNTVQCSLVSQDLKASSYHTLPGASKQIKTPRFTPIKPKSSPQKSSSYSKTGADIPAYDKRPVSAILKEKREREKAEALAKIQASIRLPAIPSLPGIQLQQVTPSLSLNPGQVKSITPLSGEMLKLQATSNIPTKDVVIFVNNNSTAAVPTVITPASGQCIQNQLVPVTVSETKLALEVKSQTDVNNSKEGEMNEDKILSERDTPNIEDIVFSPENGNSSVHTADLKDEPSEIRSNESGDANHSLNEEEGHESMEIERTEEQKSDESVNNQDELPEERLDSIESQTPIKIAKLNVESPFRPESACSLGRETPIRIMKTGDMSLSRPESACSHGRETPSGARKRKSSGNMQQRNFKRLNSTGEVEGNENISQYDLCSNLLDPQKVELRMFNQRRTHSCTLELDKDRKKSGFNRHNKSFTLDNIGASLQSPDITSLEREALIDAFPYTACPIKPSKTQAQKSSVGISSESFRNALKLKKQQEYLNERVNSFLMKENTMRSMETVNEQMIKINSDSAQFLTNDMSSSKNVKASRDLELESDIPSEVADFINETIEKRQSANNSALSEPSLISEEQAAGPDLETGKIEDQNGPLVTDNVKFLGINMINQNKRIDKLNDAKQFAEEVKADGYFTVPKVPPFNFRLRECNIRFPAPNIYSNQQRCSSLPTFTSPVRSPVSPQGRQGDSQTASSISPVIGQSPDREISKISQGALRHVEVRENHPISVNIHANVSMTDDGMFVRPNSLPIRITHHEDKGLPTAPYLASLQHNLQKPRETPVDQRSVRQKESPVEKQGISFSPVGRGQLSRESSAERTSFTPFSDRGYHSIGSSPILNSTPVSHSEIDALNTRQSPRYSVPSGVILSPQNQSSQIPLSPEVNFGQMVSSTDAAVISINQLNSSTTSAFIPIQGSSKDIRYVTPIRPMATVASEKTDNTVLNPSSGIQEIQTTLISASNKVQDPPPYEYAVKQLRKSNSNLGINENMNVCENLKLEQVSNADVNERGSLLATMGQPSDQTSIKQMGPCSSRLAELSRQSKQNCTVKPSDSHPNVISALSVPSKGIGQLFLDEQNKVADGFSDGGIYYQEMNEESDVIPANISTNDLIAINQHFNVSESSEVEKHSDIHIPDVIPVFGESENISSFTNAHSNKVAPKMDTDDVKEKIFYPSLDIISTENVLHSNVTRGKIMQSNPNKLLSSIHHRHSGFAANICSLAQNTLQEDPYQEMSRHEFTTTDVDPLGNTLEDLKEILSDKSVVVDNGFYAEADMSANEEGIGELLFGDE